MLNARLKSITEKILPGFLRRWLDPFQALIESEVAVVASRTGAGDIVLDAGAGEARHRKYFEKGRYIAVDSGLGDADWDYSGLDLIADLEDLPIFDESVDWVLCLVVLEHTKKPKEVLQEFGRVLKGGGQLSLVVPMMWEEHQEPHDYFRFTRYGVRSLFEGLPFHVEHLEPMGGFFWVFARRCVNMLGFFQGSWRWLLFLLMAPFLGFLLPLILYWLDKIDRNRNFTLGFQVRARRLAK